VRHVLERRADLAVTCGGRAGGRLLVYFPGNNLADGAAEVETAGFFDHDNVPPWDTWVGFFRDEAAPLGFAELLVAFVPKAFVPRVELGIWANPEQCIQWLESACVPLASGLRDRLID
jgi:hypothetical protein